MTDRAHSLQVILKDDYRVDDLQRLIDAILLMHGVIKVLPLISENMIMTVAEERAKLNVINKIRDILK